MIADLDFLKTPREWSGLNCCVKNLSQCGYPSDWKKIRHGYVGSDINGQVVPVVTVIGILGAHQLEEFSSVEDMIAAGWVVD